MHSTKTSHQITKAAIVIIGCKQLAFSFGSLLENNWLFQINAFLKTQVAKIWNLLRNPPCYFEASLKTHQPAFTSSSQQVVTCSRANHRTSFPPYSIWQTSQWPYASLVVTKIHFTHCSKFGSTLRKHLWYSPICPSTPVEGNWFIWSFQSHKRQTKMFDKHDLKCSVRKERKSE